MKLYDTDYLLKDKDNNFQTFDNGDYIIYSESAKDEGGIMIEIDNEETKTCEECPTILDIDDFFLCQDCEEEQEKA